MASLSDHQLIEQSQLGQGEALGQLFDRHGAGVFDFIARVMGDPDEAIHLLVDVFARFPQAAAGIPEHESIRGALFSLARETALSYLRRRGWLDALPPLMPLSGAASDLANDIWQAARAMPASQRAVLAIVEHQSLSPAEQAAALGIARHALPDVTAEARRTFDELFDLHARAEGKPTSASVDAGLVPGLQRRNPDSNASLFTFLPSIVLLDAAQSRVRSQIVAAVGSQPEAEMLPPMLVQPPPQERVPGVERDLAPMLIGLALFAAFLIAILAALAINNAQQTANAGSNPPVIRQVDPPDGAMLSSGAGVVVQAVYGDNRAIDLKSVRLILDGRDVTVESTVAETSVSYVADLGPGQHIAVVELKDTSGTTASRTWQFTVAGFTATPTTTPLPTPTNLPSATPLPTATRAPTSTPLPPPTQTPVPPLPDLVVTDISLSPDAEIIYAIQNSGNGDVTAPFLIQVFVDGVIVDANRKVSTLGAGQSISLFVPNYRLSGTHTVSVSVNSDRSIKESDYGNDELTRTLTGPTPTPSPIPTSTPSPTPTSSPTP